MKKFAKPIIITIICSLLVLFLKNQFSSLLLTNATYGMPALINQGQIENLYIGSSMFRQGLDIMTLEASAENTNYILAYNGNQPALEYYQLKNLLGHNVKINHLFIDMYVYSAWETPEISDEKLFMEIGLKEKWDLWNLISNEPQTSFESLFRMFVSSNNELLLTWPVNAMLINSQFYRGGTLTRTSGADAEVLAHTTAPEISENMNETQEYYLGQLIELARENNISVTLLETPKYNTVASDSSYLQAMEKYVAFANQENVSVILSENTSGYLKNTAYSAVSYHFDHKNAAYFMDSIHLSYEGRVAFTALLTHHEIPNKFRCTADPFKRVARTDQDMSEPPTSLQAASLPLPQRSLLY